MTRLAWGAHGERFFEAGTDRGVLYLPGTTGVPWNGLKAVNESPDGGSPTPYYIDGYKYLNVASAEEFKATLEAFSAPMEFGVCDGTKSIHNGLFATQQPRRPFHLSYRTLVGNDTEGSEYGYKIHIVYNALAAPSVRNNQTQGESVNPLGLSWAITTTPPGMTGLKPTAHFVIDSRTTPPGLLNAIEKILYGSDEGDARMPDATELRDLFSGPAPIIGTNLAWNPDVLNLDGFEEESVEMATLSYEETAARFTLTTSGTARLSMGQYVEFEEGVEYRVLMEVRANRLLRVIPQIGGTPGSIQTVLDTWRWISADIVCGPGGTYDHGLLMSSDVPYGSGDWVEVRKILYSSPEYRGPHFSGATPDTDMHVYEWVDPEDAPYGESTVRSWY